jgi:DNA (cytosine-5)-methyltransferase 1
MRFGSLFSGIGGLDLGLERAGMSCAWQVERDEYRRAILARQFNSKSKIFPDVKDCGSRDLGLNPVDLICGGFPCQPVSVAGRQLAQNDNRWLWPEFARILGELQPQYALIENTPGLLSVNRGSAMGDILGDLVTLGYNAEWQTIPAAAFYAPHLRFRVFIVAHRGDRPPVFSAENPPRPSHDALMLWSREPLISDLLGDKTSEEWKDIFIPRLGKATDRKHKIGGLGDAVVPEVARWVGEQIIKNSLESTAAEKMPQHEDVIAIYDQQWTLPQRSMFEASQRVLFLQPWPRAGFLDATNRRVSKRAQLIPNINNAQEWKAWHDTLFPTPTSQEPGWKNNTVVDRNGNDPEHSNQRFYDKETGRLVQKGLTQVARMFPATAGEEKNLWPTPKSSPSGPDYARVNREGSGGDDLATAVARRSIPTPQASDHRSGKGYSHEGKTQTPQLRHNSGGQLNPTWVAWLMGFPLDWLHKSKDDALDEVKNQISALAKPGQPREAASNKSAET